MASQEPCRLGWVDGTALHPTLRKRRRNWGPKGLEPVCFQLWRAVKTPENPSKIHPNHEMQHVFEDKIILKHLEKSHKCINVNKHVFFRFQISRLCSNFQTLESSKFFGQETMWRDRGFSPCVLPSLFLPCPKCDICEHHGAGNRWYQETIVVIWGWVKTLSPWWTSK